MECFVVSVVCGWVAINVVVAVARVWAELQPDWYNDSVGEQFRAYDNDMKLNDEFINALDTIFPLYFYGMKAVARVSQMVRDSVERVYIFTTCISIIIDTRSSNSCQTQPQNVLSQDTPTRSRSIRAPSSHK